MRIRHHAGEYEFVTGTGVLDDGALRATILARPVAIVTDENVASHWLDTLRAILPDAATLVLPPGESAKTLETAARIWTFLAERHFGRDTVLVALGGGVIGDLTGFAASCWMRGIDFIQVPTTLLAQVDASIGGKTGVNLGEGKNLVGTFHAPLAVFADTLTLRTLPDREFLAGFAEIVKAALVADPVFLEWLEGNAVRLRERQPAALAHAIHRSAEIKASIVSADEREQGRRVVLNLGHTFAHALETATAYERFLHGEAVGIGLVQAAALSETLCGLDAALRPRLVALLAAFGLPTRLPDDVPGDVLLDAIRGDKKHVANWRFVVLEAPGKPLLHDVVDETVIRALLEASR